MLELDFELPPPLPQGRVLLLHLPPPPGLAWESLLNSSWKRASLRKGPVSPLKTTVFPTVQESENDQDDTLVIQGVVHCDEFFYLWKRQIVVFGLLVPGE